MRVELVNQQESSKRQWFELPVAVPTADNPATFQLVRLARIPGKGAALSPLIVGGVESPIGNLQRHIPQDATLEQLDALARKISTMGSAEQLKFEGALDIEDIRDMDGLLRLTERLGQYDALYDVADSLDLGIRLVDSGVVHIPTEMLPHVDYARVGNEYSAKHSGTFTSGAYVVRQTGASGQSTEADLSKLPGLERRGTEDGQGQESVLKMG